MPNDPDNSMPIKSETRIQGAWQETAEGYTLEIRLPISMIGSKLSFAISDVDDPGHLTSGSMLLAAHHVDVSFGNVTVEPLSAVRQDLDITKVGSGSVDIDPSGQTDYTFGSEVTLTAVPAFGYRFLEWQGDVNGVDETVTITMDGDKAVTAVFAPDRTASPKSNTAKPGMTVSRSITQTASPVVSSISTFSNFVSL